MSTRRYPALAVASVLLIAGCQATTLPTPECAAPRRSAVDYGPPSPLASMVSIAIELRGSYLAERVRHSLETPLPAVASEQDLAAPPGAPNYIPSSGVTVQAVALEEQPTPERLNLLTVRLSPWIRQQGGDSASGWQLSKTEIQRYFELRLRLRPRLVTESGASRVIVPLEIHELRDVSNGEEVRCAGGERNPSYDVLTEKVHQGVLDAIYGTEEKEGAPPLLLPGQKMVELVQGIAASPMQLTGIALGTEGDMKIGFLMDQGTPLPFSPTTSLSRYPEADWGVLIDPSFITAAITSKVKKAAQDNVPPVTVSSVDVSYEQEFTPAGRRNVIRVSAPASATTLLCQVPVAIDVEIFPDIRAVSGDTFALIAPMRQEATPTVTPCIVFEKLFFGTANATVCSPGPCAPPPPPDPCPRMLTVQFDVGGSDTFYGTGMDTDGVFYLAGRSTFMDGILAAKGRPPRTPVPACP